MAKLAVEISKDAKSNLARELTRTQAKVAELEGKLKTTAKAGQRAGREMKSAFGPQALTSLTTYVGGVASVGTALMALRAHYATWLKDIKETSAEARKASNEIVAFAALQEGGTKAKRVQAAAALAARYGIAERGEAFNTIQALQSARGGDIATGMAAAQTVFAAARVGIPVERGRELEVLGAAQGQKPGQALRRAFVAGQLSARDPGVLAGAAAGLTFWQDKDLGFAAAAVLAGAVRPDELQTYVKAGGIGLSKTSSEKFQATLKKLGVQDASRLEKLYALREAKIDTPEKLKAAGLTEIRQQQALSTLVQNAEMVARFAEVIPREAKPGLLVRQRKAVEAELPATRIARRIEEVGVEYMDELAFGDRSQLAMVEELRARMRGVSLRRLGRRQGWLGRDFMDEEGRVFPFDWFRARLGEQLERGGARDVPLGADGGPDRGPITAAGERIESEIGELLRGPAEALQEAADQMRQAAGQMKGGPTMVVPTEDR